MLGLVCLVALVQVSWQIKDLGVDNYKCDATVMAKSKVNPTNADQVRFADFKVVGALGDSLTAANGAGSEPGDPLSIILQYRGLAFAAGGDFTLEKHVTIPNILRKFNPSLFGYSKGIGTEDVWDIAYVRFLNNISEGAESGDIYDQALDLVATMQRHPEKIDIQNDWKLINVFIGANDLCTYCHNKIQDPALSHAPAQFRDNIIKAVQVLYDNLPKTIVQLVGMFNMRMLRQIDKNNEFCQGLHLFECDCEIKKSFTDQEIGEVCNDFMASEQQIQDNGTFTGKQDFTLVIQPFFEQILTPPMKSDGSGVDMSFFAPDCFHFSAFGHAVVAKNLWNTVLQPVGSKQKKVDLSNYNVPINCPPKTCPFYPTVGNSKNCAALMTDYET
uniref:Lipase_GDSL domain-containing protein n=1 Tax=Rhabditophanes sp. KR3021 TaxID=114890 RepID=A0AC35TFQ9_9BILA